MDAWACFRADLSVGWAFVLFRELLLGLNLALDLDLGSYLDADLAFLLAFRRADFRGGGEGGEEEVGDADDDNGGGGLVAVLGY